jgi:hypothetical protein
MVLMLWINGYRHDFSSDEAFNLVVGVAAGDVTLEDRRGDDCDPSRQRVAVHFAWSSQVLRVAKEGVDNVHTFGFGLGRTSVGLRRR